MANEVIARAIVRATSCGAKHATPCVLSHEVGYQVPAVMLWSQEESKMRMFLLPHVTGPYGDVAAQGGSPVRVALIRPPFSNDDEHSDPPTVLMNRTIVVEHFDMHTHQRMRETMHDEDAYCLQMLAHSVPLECESDL